jgi:processive 1,2-diacylglycerol beta-glucosyltransferase
MPKRVLILSVSAGAGHVRAAQALKKAFLMEDNSLVVESQDVLDLTNKLFRHLYSKAYIDLVNAAPEFMGFLYDRTDRPSRSGKNRRDKLRLAFDRLNTQKFVKYLKRFQPDMIVNTHFLPAEIVSNLKERQEVNIPQFVVVTDFEVHRIWLYNRVEQYFVAAEEAKRQLIKLGVPDAQIRVSGIPIDPIFLENKDRTALVRKFGLSGDRKTLLILCGGFGVGPVDAIVGSLFEIRQPIQLVVVAGKNAELKARLDNLAASTPMPVQVLGFTTEIDELMQVADLVITKPGGLTTSEALAKQLVMVIVNPIPGQESRNSDFLLENGAAIKANNLSTIGYKIERLLADPERLDRMRQNIRRLHRPEAALEIARTLLSPSFA